VLGFTEVLLLFFLAHDKLKGSLALTAISLASKELSVFEAKDTLVVKGQSRWGCIGQRVSISLGHSWIQLYCNEIKHSKLWIILPHCLSYSSKQSK